MATGTGPKVQRSGRNRARMLISCPDRPGIVAAVSDFLFTQGANIISSDQYSSDPSQGTFFMRLEFDLPGITTRKEEIARAFEPLARSLAMTWRFETLRPRKRMAIFASREEHCLLELLWRWRSGELEVEIPLVISNHEILSEAAQRFGLPFVYIPVEPEQRQKAEEEQMHRLADAAVDLIVLARYMQILSPTMVDRYPGRIINIHHSFLPAFAGAKPYEQAYARGVKIIGATAHYVTTDLDAGPIIEQDVQRVTHRDNVDDLKRIGRQIERSVLARAVAWHLESRVLIHGNRTVVFR